MKNYLIYFLSLFLLLSCKKDKLEEGKELFIGTWNWIYSEHEYNICQGFAQNEILTPETENRNYSIEFLEKEIANFYENDKLVLKERMVVSSFGGDSGASFKKPVYPESNDA